MKTFLLLICAIFGISGCAYNSRNILDVRGEKMTFSYGLIAIKDVYRVLIYRESNIGDTAPLAPYNFEPAQSFGNMTNAVN